jgi:hypothetical protein
MSLCKCGCGVDAGVYLHNEYRPGKPKHPKGSPKEFCIGHANAAKVQDLSGQRFFSWTVVKRVSATETEMGKWICRCVCGNEANLKTSELKNGKRKGCEGCFHKSQIKNDSAFRRLLDNYRRNAHKRNLEWALTDEEFRILTSSPCFYTGRPPANVQYSTTTRVAEPYVYNGIDRRDSSKGYTLENCVSCAEAVNYAKRASEFEDFLEMCRQIATLHP